MLAGGPLCYKHSRVFSRVRNSTIPFRRQEKINRPLFATSQAHFHGYSVYFLVSVLFYRPCLTQITVGSARNLMWLFCLFQEASALSTTALTAAWFQFMLMSKHQWNMKEAWVNVKWMPCSPWSVVIGTGPWFAGILNKLEQFEHRVWFFIYSPRFQLFWIHEIFKRPLLHFLAY